MSIDEVEQPTPIENEPAPEVEVSADEGEVVPFEQEPEAAPEPTEPAPTPEVKDTVDADLEHFRRRALEAEARAAAASELFTKNMTQEQQQLQHQQEQERLYNMTPEERFAETARQAEERVNNIVADSERRIEDASDRAAFAEAVAENPVLASVREEAEAELEKARAEGRNHRREDLAIFLAGKKAVAAGKAGGSVKQKAAAAENIERSEAAPTSSGGDQRSNGRVEVDAKEARNERLRRGKRG